MDFRRFALRQGIAKYRDGLWRELNREQVPVCTQ
jgi:hypothetical protein